MSASVRVVHHARLVSGARAVDDGWLLIENDVIRARGEGAGWTEHLAADAAYTEIDAGGCAVSPGLVDIHTHGAAGWSFEAALAAAAQGDDAPLAELLAAHRSRGTTRLVASLVSAPVAALVASLRVVAEHRGGMLLGAHLEGPFLAANARGAHDPDALTAPDAAAVGELMDAVPPGVIRQVTLAPELPGGLAAVRALVAAGIRVGVGHTEASFAESSEAFASGATLLTHAFNAMPPLHHRAPGPIGAALAQDGVVVELIADGVHVHPAMLDLLFRAAPGRVAVVSDAIGAAAMGDGDYVLGGLSVTVRDGIPRLTGTDTIAGSARTLGEMLPVLIAAGVTPEAALHAMTHVPARALGVEDQLGLLEPGYPADLVLWDADWRPTLLSDGTP